MQTLKPLSSALSQFPTWMIALMFILCLAAGSIQAKDEPNDAKKTAKGGDKVVAGMSIVGNDEAPKSLVIVPWKSSGLGQSLDVSRIMEDGRRPVDREVFGRELDYYELRTGINP